MTNEQNTKTIVSVETTFDIIESLKQLRTGGVSEIADKSDVPISTTYTHLTTLYERGYIIKNEDQYQLSFRFLEHGGAVRNQLDYFDVVQEETNEISSATDEIAGFAIEELGKRVIIYRSEGKLSIGDKIPMGEYTYLHWTSLGKAILAHLSQPRVDKILDQHGLPQGTPNTITTRDELFSELDHIREQGYAIDNSERRRGISGVAVPILDEKKNIVGAIGVAGPKTRFDESYIADLLSLLFEKKNIIEIKSDFYE